MEQHTVARFDGSQIEDQRIGHRVAKGQCGCLAEAHRVRDFVDVFFGYGHQLGPCLELGKSHNAIANGKVGDAFAESLHLTGTLKAENARCLRG